MRENWQDVPRDPIADDDVIEYLYKRSTARRPDTLDNRDALTSKTQNLEEQKKRPGSVRTLWPLKKLFSR